MFDALISDAEACGDAGFSLVKLAVPSLTLVVEIRGETHAVKSWVGDDDRSLRAPWDGDVGFIQELFYGVSVVKGRSYKDAFRRCLRKQLEDALSKAQLSFTEHDRRCQQLTLTMRTLKAEYCGWMQEYAELKTIHNVRKREEILSKARSREPNAWSPSAVRLAEVHRSAGSSAAAGRDAAAAASAAAVAAQTRRAMSAPLPPPTHSSPHTHDSRNDSSALAAVCADRSQGTACGRGHGEQGKGGGKRDGHKDASRADEATALALSLADKKQHIVAHRNKVCVCLRPRALVLWIGVFRFVSGFLPFTPSLACIASVHSCILIRPFAPQILTLNPKP